MDRELYQFLRNRIVQRLQRTNPEKAIDIAYVHNKVLTLIEEGEECICQGISAEEIKPYLNRIIEMFRGKDLRKGVECPEEIEAIRNALLTRITARGY